MGVVMKVSFYHKYKSIIESMLNYTDFKCSNEDLFISIIENKLIVETYINEEYDKPITIDFHIKDDNMLLGNISYKKDNKVEKDSFLFKNIIDNDYKLIIIPTKNLSNPIVNSFKLSNEIYIDDNQKHLRLLYK